MNVVSCGELHGFREEMHVRGGNYDSASGDFATHPFQISTAIAVDCGSVAPVRELQPWAMTV